MKNHIQVKSMAGLFFAVVFALVLSSTAQAEDFYVNTVDDLDDGACTTSHCSLREAINAANANPGADMIAFDLGAGMKRILLGRDLPMIFDNLTTIQGPTSAGDLVILDGTPGARVGLWLDSDSNVVEHMVMVGFAQSGLVVTGDYNTIRWNIIGSGPEVSLANGNGLQLEGDSNLISGNLISGNRGAGINAIRATNALIVGNKIGTDLTGSLDWGNQIGIRISVSQSIQIGHLHERPNLISGNDLYGIQITTGAEDIEIINNRIGTDSSGTAALPNTTGIAVFSGAVAIGGDGARGNLIAGNAHNGILVRTEDRVFIFGNEIGKGRIPNGTGIYIGHAPDGVIGNSEAGNKISYNLDDGIFIQNGERLYISNNEIKHNGGTGIHVQRSLDTDRIQIRWNNIGYNRGGKGIQYDNPSTNGGIQPPTLISLTYGSVLVGSSCPYCVIDLFLSDLDPSGYGEGYRYLESVHANADGYFIMPADRVTRCDAITTTATDTESRTSEYSLTWRGIDCSLPIPTIPILIGITVILGITAIPRIWHKPGSLPNTLIGITGILATVLLILGILFLRFGGLPVNYRGGSAPVEENQGVGPCGDLIDMEKLQPQIGAIYPVDQPPRLAWNLAVNPELPGEMRWKVDLINPSGESASQVIDSSSIPLTDFGIAADLEGTYRWRVQAEWLNPQSGKWQGYCEEPLFWFFYLGDEIQALETQAVETPLTSAEVETETPEPGTGLPTARARVNLNCRQGPNEIYGWVGNFREGETAAIEGRNENGTWWYLQPPQVAVHCWVLGLGVDTSGDLASLPVVMAPPLPSFTPTWTPTATASPPQCSDFKTQNECLSHANDLGCAWQNNVCVKQ